MVGARGPADYDGTGREEGQERCGVRALLRGHPGGRALPVGRFGHRHPAVEGPPVPLRPPGHGVGRRLARARKGGDWYGHQAPVSRGGVRGLRRGGVCVVGAGPPASRQTARGGLRRGQGGPRRWMLYLLLLMPLSVVVLWKSVRVTDATEFVYFVGFFAFSAAAGLG